MGDGSGEQEPILGRRREGGTRGHGAPIIPVDLTQMQRQRQLWRRLRSSRRRPQSIEPPAGPFGALQAQAQWDMLVTRQEHNGFSLKAAENPDLTLIPAGLCLK